MHAPRVTSRISRLALVACWLFAAAASGCLDADRDSLVVTPARPKSDDKPSRSATSLGKRFSESQGTRESRPVRDARLAAELAQVDELLRTVGHQTVADSRDGGSPRLAFADESESKTEKKPRDKDRSETNGRKTIQRVEDLLPKGGRRNRLAKESSPYLLLHAHNPVNWYPWGPEAFETAQRDNKLIFLSIGYSSCHWCHVMERLVFSNEAIAKFMNEHFVCVKVDREERPDIDDIYMTSLTVYFRLSGSEQGGGWPLSLFLSPTGKPIAGGTYFPPDDDGGRMGFPSVMRKIFELWRDEQAVLEKNADILTQQVQRLMSSKLALKETPLTVELATQTAQAIADTYDEKFGGFDFHSLRPNAPKFPVPCKLSLLMYQAQRSRDDDMRKKVTGTLDALAAGGIRDHLAGGFHRYSTDRAWKVPHFEKMLYDNAQLADIYVEAFRQTDSPAYRAVAEEICDFVLRDMTDARGGFYSALDADTDDVEGKYYVWSDQEIDDTLGPDEVELFKLAYGFGEPNTFEPGRVLHRPRPLAEVAAQLKITPEKLDRLLASSRQKLLKVRNHRAPPLCDDKVLTGWNGLMIKALANAGSRFRRADYVAAAERAALAVLTDLCDENGRLLRSYRGGPSKITAYLDDYAYLVDGLIALHLATREQNWLVDAKRITDDQIRLFWDNSGNGFFFTATDHEELFARSKDRFDSVVPSGNGTSIRNLLRLASLTRNNGYREKAEQTLQAFAGQMPESPNGSAVLALGLLEFLDKPDFESTRRTLNPNVVPAADETVKIAVKPESGGSKPNNAAVNNTAVNNTAVNNAAVKSLPNSADSVPTADKDKQRSDKPKQTEVLTVEAHLNVDRLPAGSTCRIALVLNINDGWHINQNPAQPDDLVPTQFTMKTKLGSKLVDVKYPKGYKLTISGFDEPLMVYEKQTIVFGTIEVPADAGGKNEKFELQVKYQACNDKNCVLPKTLKLDGSVKVAPAGEAVKTINDKLFNPPKPSGAKKSS